MWRTNRRALLWILSLAMVAALIVPPVRAHVVGPVSHLWRQHIRPLAANLFYTKSQSRNRFVPKAGLIIHNVDSFTWELVPDSAGTVEHYSNATTFTKSTAGVGQLSITGGLSIPATLYGRSLDLRAFELCYDATGTSTLNSIAVNVWRPSNGPAPGYPFASATDQSNRDDKACRLYKLSRRTTIRPRDSLNIFGVVNFSAAGSFSVGGITLYLAPTGTNPKLPAGGTTVEVMNV